LNVTINAPQRILVGFERAREVIPTSLNRRTKEVPAALMRSLTINIAGKQTLLHGDVHPGNWYVTGDNRMGLFDWQCVVRRVVIHDDLVLNLDDHTEIVISAPLRLTLPETEAYPAEVVAIDARSIPPDQRPLLDIAGATCTRAGWGADGNLHLEFSGGHQIDVVSSEHVTAWELYGKHHGYIACLPRGEVRSVRHDQPLDASTG
jgi:Family of unknown function (DUF6188)/Phosphotransferase enzyme family